MLGLSKSTIQHFPSFLLFLYFMQVFCTVTTLAGRSDHTARLHPARNQPHPQFMLFPKAKDPLVGPVAALLAELDVEVPDEPRQD